MGDIFKLEEFIEPWKDFGTVLKGELKRTVINFNLLLQLTLGPTLTGSEYAKVMLKNKEKIGKIDTEVNAALEKLPAGAAGNAMMWAVAPGPMLFNAAREVSGKVSPESVGKFMDEYGFTDLSLGPVPVGKWFKKGAKSAAQVGGFATLNRDAYEDIEKMKERSKGKWYDPIEKLLLLRNPFGSAAGTAEESLGRTGNLILEADKQPNEEEAFLDYLKLSGFENKYLSQTGAPYVEAKEQLITGLVDLFEKDIEETAKIATAPTFVEFVKEIQAAKTEKFKQVNGQQMVSQMKKEVENLIADEETLNKFMEVTGKQVSEFEGKEDKLKEFIAQKIYEKEFTKMRMQSIQSIEDGVEEIKIEILSGMEENDLDQLKINPLGDQLYNIIKSGLDRLNKAASSISQTRQQVEKAGK